MSKIVVTGATGFVGYHVAKKLVGADWGEVVCLARPGSPREFLNQLHVKVVEGDLRDARSLENVCRGAELLFHVAADYRLWARHPQELFLSNVGGTANLLSAAMECGVKKVVYTSSVSAVGRPEPHAKMRADYSRLSGEEREQWEKLYQGDESLDPTAAQQIGPYKQSKYLAELKVREFVREGCPAIIVNPSTPVGSHDVKPTQTGKLILDFLNHRMPAYLDTGLNLVDVEDVALGHLLAAEKGRVGERYILGNKNMMLKELLDLLARVTGLTAPRYKIPYAIAFAAGAVSTLLAEATGRSPGIPLDGVKMAREVMFYSPSKAVRELNLPQSSVEEALAKAARFFSDRGYVKG